MVDDLAATVGVSNQTISVSSVSDDGSPVNSFLQYKWNLDGNVVATTSSYTPPSVGNHVLSVTVTYTGDPTQESTTIPVVYTNETFSTDTNNQSIAVIGSGVTVNFGAPNGLTNLNDNGNTVTVTGTGVTLNFNGEDNNANNTVILLGGGSDIVTFNGDTNQNGNTIVLGSSQDTIKFGSASALPPPSAPDTITGFNSTDKIDLHLITQLTNFLKPEQTSPFTLKPGYVAWSSDGTNTYVWGNTSTGNESVGGGPNPPPNFEIKLTGNISLASANFPGLPAVASPAGIAGSPINLALVNQAVAVGTPTTVTVANLPAGWSLTHGTQNADAIWSVQTLDPSTLTVTAPATCSGAVVVNVTESWTNPDGSNGSTVITDNVEAYAPGSPIFALSGDDNLTGAGANDLFVFAQPIGHDTIYNFNAATDSIDLIGFAGIASFSDIAANLADDANGNAVITLASGETITLLAVDAASLGASNFVFDQTPVITNTATMVIGDDARLPLSGVVNNAGTILLNSSGAETELQLIQHGITLQGGGKIILSDISANVIFGTDPSVTLTNVDNTISGAGHLGNGQMTLVNHGTIVADGNNALVIDTGANVITNSGTLLSTGSGGLLIYSDVANSGLLWADGGNITVEGNVSGDGSAIIDGSAVMEITGTHSCSVTFHSPTGELILDNSAGFTGTIYGFCGDGTLTSAQLMPASQRTSPRRDDVRTR
jgi:hypothetical protein